MAIRLRELADQYAHHSGRPEITVFEAVAWAIDNGHLDSRLPREESLEVWRDLMSTSLQEDTIKVDGRVVRVRLCASVDVPNGDDEPSQRTLWAHVDDAPRDFIKKSFEQRRRGIYADVARFQIDLDYANRRLRARGLRPIQLSLEWPRDDQSSQGEA
jgi:hypothetical protein